MTQADKDYQLVVAGSSTRVLQTVRNCICLDLDDRFLPLEHQRDWRVDIAIINAELARRIQQWPQ